MGLWTDGGEQLIAPHGWSGLVRSGLGWCECLRVGEACGPPTMFVPLFDAASGVKRLAARGPPADHRSCSAERVPHINPTDWAGRGSSVTSAAAADKPSLCLSSSLKVN